MLFSTEKFFSRYKKSDTTWSSFFLMKYWFSQGKTYIESKQHDPKFMFLHKNTGVFPTDFYIFYNLFSILGRKINLKQTQKFGLKWIYWSRNAASKHRAKQDFAIAINCHVQTKLFSKRFNFTHQKLTFSWVNKNHCFNQRTRFHPKLHPKIGLKTMGWINFTQFRVSR